MPQLKGMTPKMRNAIPGKLLPSIDPNQFIKKKSKEPKSPQSPISPSEDAENTRKIEKK